MNDDQYLVDWLSSRDAQCPLCKYNLRGLTTPVCPECGNHLRLSVSVVDPFIKGWVVIVTSLLLPAGLGLLWVVMLPRNGLPRGRESGAAAGIFYDIAAIPLAAYALSSRRRIQRWSRPAQCLVAAFAVALCGISFAMLFSGFVR